MTSPVRPTPIVTDLTRPFWEAAREGRLVIQRCGDCAYYNHPPKPQCDRCQSSNLAFEEVSGRGTVWSYTVMHQKSVAGFEASVPYLTALVELDEQPMLLLVTNLPGVDPDAVKIFARVYVNYETLADGVALPQFVLDSPSPRKPALSEVEGERGQGGEV